MKRILTILLLNLSFFTLCAQENEASADELFARARTLAFDEKDYQQAIALTKQALSQAPDYTDLSVFLGRLYTWSDQTDSARTVFEGLRRKNVTDADMFHAYASLLYWNDMSDQAIEVVNEGLKHHPGSDDLLFLKARISFSADNYMEADRTIETLLQQNPEHTEARALSKTLRNYAEKNAVGISYTFTHFDKQFEDNWHIVSLSYRRATPIGSVIFKTNYANKFAESGYQFELEAYPRLSDMFYMYVGTAYSGDVGIFPEYRTGASLYANLPSSFEGEVGFRQLHFTDDIWMYTASVGKYYKNFWFNLRTYLTPAESNISHSYTGTVRYYTKGANDYFGFQVGTGISPEENRNNLLDMDMYKLKTFKVGAEYNFSIQRTHLISFSGTFFNQEYRPNEKGNQFDIGISYSKVF